MSDGVLIDFICCGRDEGCMWRETWAEADALRQSYMEADMAGHDRVAIIRWAAPTVPTKEAQ